MTRFLFAAAATALALGVAPAALAASDYLLELDGVDGAAPATIDIQSWSWGVSNSTAGGPGASGRLRESPTKRSSDQSAGRVAAGDLDGDGAAELAAAAEIHSFTLSFDKSSPQLAHYCAKGAHFPKATLQARAERFELADATIAECTDSSRAAAARDTMPNRISMNLSTPRQTQGAGSADDDQRPAQAHQDWPRHLAQVTGLHLQCAAALRFVFNGSLNFRC
jgi:type VI protein secretion system component Hcp